MYLADTGEAIYTMNRLNSCRTMKRLECSSFINDTVGMIQKHSWSPDACYGEALKTGFSHVPIWSVQRHFTTI